MKASAFCPFYEEVRPAEPLYQIDGFSIVRCLDSGLVYLENPLSDEELARFYSVEYFEGEKSRKGYASYQADEEVLRANFRHLLALLPKGPSRRLLDYGCAYGFFLDEARRSFEHVAGVELSEEVARIGRERFGLDIRSGANAIDTFEDASFDVVTMWDVIEHLLRPRSTLMQCARVLRSGGELHLTTGDIGSPLARLTGRRWRLMNPPQHITYFSEATLTGLLKECGLEVIGTERVGKEVSLRFFLFILGYLLGRPIELPGFASRLAAKRIYINLFDLMLVRARKV